MAIVLSLWFTQGRFSQLESGCCEIISKIPGGCPASWSGKLFEQMSPVSCGYSANHSPGSVYFYFPFFLTVTLLQRHGSAS